MSCTLKDKILSFDRPVPRYTSYPTAPHFKPAETPQTYKSWLASLSNGSRVSLYIHVPFCPKMCWYCGCHTKITQRYAPVEDYAHLLLREINILRHFLPEAIHISHIHFGGGSPGMLRANDFSKIMQAIHTSFTVEKSAEIAIEIDPRGVTEGRVAAYAASGVNRISLGVQDFNEKVLASVNRQQPFHLTYDAINLFRSYGIDAINMDVMYGLPYQTIESIRATMDSVVMLKPSRVAFFGYAHVPWMKKHMTLINDNTLPNKNERYDLFDEGKSVLDKAGYQMIGIDHFAKPDDPLAIAAQNRTLRRNFQGYTNDAADALIGLGISSIGNMQQGFAQNSPDKPVYEKAILAGELPVTKIYEMTSEDKLRAAIIESLMCNFEVDIAQICTDHGFPKSYLRHTYEVLKPYVDANIVKIESDFIRVDKSAPLVVRLVSAAFDANLSSNAHDKPRHAKAV